MVFDSKLLLKKQQGKTIHDDELEEEYQEKEIDLEQEQDDSDEDDES